MITIQNFSHTTDNQSVNSFRGDWIGFGVNDTKSYLGYDSIFRVVFMGLSFYLFILFISYLLNHNRKDSKYTRYHTCFPCDGLGKVTAAKILPVSRTGFISSQTYLELVNLRDLNFQSVFRVFFS